MKLNNYSYVHVKIRKLSQLLAYYTGMNLVTNFDEEFTQIKFMNQLSYLILDYQKNVCFAMSHKITKQEQEIIEELMVCLDWLEVGHRYQTKHN